ncbi:hypothetical protein BH09ACT7_BH09ACT7_19230 [soil metagenome]
MRVRAGSYSRSTTNAAAWPVMPFTGYRACATVGVAFGVPSQIVSPGAHNAMVFGRVEAADGDRRSAVGLQELR